MHCIYITASCTNSPRTEVNPLVHAVPEISRLSPRKSGLWLEIGLNVQEGNLQNRRHTKSGQFGPLTFLEANITEELAFLNILSLTSHSGFQSIFV